MPNPKPPSPGNANSQESCSLTTYSHPHQQYVDHSYTDYSNVDEDDLRLMREAGDTKGAPTKLLGRRTGAGNKSYPTYGMAKAPYGSSAIMPFPGKVSS